MVFAAPFKCSPKHCGKQKQPFRTSILHQVVKPFFDYEFIQSNCTIKKSTWPQVTMHIQLNYAIR